MIFCPLRILYNSIFIIMATSLGTNVVVVTRFTVFRNVLKQANGLYQVKRCLGTYTDSEGPDHPVSPLSIKVSLFFEEHNKDDMARRRRLFNPPTRSIIHSEEDSCPF